MKQQPLFQIPRFQETWLKASIELTRFTKSLPLMAILFCSVLGITACGGGGGGGGGDDSAGSAPPETEQPGGDEEPQKDAHPDFYDSGLRKQPTDAILVVGTGQSVPSALHTSTTSYKTGGYYTYVDLDDVTLRFNDRSSRPQRVDIFNDGTWAGGDSSIILTLDTDGKIVQTLDNDDGHGWTYPVVNDSGFSLDELSSSGVIPGRWLGTWVSAGDSGVGSTNDWSMMHVNEERAVRVDMFSESTSANPEINLTCVVNEVLSPQELMAQARAQKTESISGVLRAVTIYVGGSVYEKKSLATQAHSSTNFTQNNFEDFDLSQLRHGLAKRQALRSEMCALTLSELSEEELTSYQDRDLLSGLTPELYDDFDWDQCLGMPTRNGAEVAAAKECRERVESKQDEIDELISQSASEIWRATYPQITKLPFELYHGEPGDYTGTASESICDFSDQDCLLMYSLLWLHSQREQLQLADMHFLNLPEVQTLFSQNNIQAAPQDLYRHWQETLEELDRSIESLRTQGLLPEAGVDVVLPSDLADPRYDPTVTNSMIASDQLRDYRHALNTYRDPQNSTEVRQGVMEEFFGSKVTSLNGALQDDVGASVELDVEMRQEIYEYNEWLKELAAQERENNNTSWTDYRQSTGTLPTTDTDNLAYEAWCSEHQHIGCGCANYSCVSEDNTCACMQ